MELNSYKPTICNKENWMDVSINLKNLSHKLRTKTENFEEEFFNIFEFIMQVAHNHDIDMEAAWNRWNKKATEQFYIS